MSYSAAWNVIVGKPSKITYNVNGSQYEVELDDVEVTVGFGGPTKIVARTYNNLKLVQPEEKKKESYPNNCSVCRRNASLGTKSVEMHPMGCFEDNSKLCLQHYAEFAAYLKKIGVLPPCETDKK
jgi:hypothetical protein